MVKDQFDKEALWHNNQWMILDNAIEEVRSDWQAMAYYYYRGQIENAPEESFRHIAEKSWVDPDQLYDCFQRLEGLWGLNADFNKLRYLADFQKEVNGIHAATTNAYKNDHPEYDGSCGLFAMEQHRSHVLKSNPTLYPLHTNGIADEGDQS